MLDLGTTGGDRDCAGLSRRDFLRIGTLGLGGLTLADLLALRAHAGSDSPGKDTAVVLLFLSGGASQIETFDPKMSAPEEVRSSTGEVQTRLPGVTFGGTFPKLAALADRMAVVRSFRHPVGDHAKAIQHVITAGNATGAGMGAILAHLRGANNPRNGMPTHALLTADEVDPQYSRERVRVITACGPGSLGAAFAPFDPSGQGQANRNMRLGITRDRLDDRRALLRALDTVNRRLDATGAMEGLDRFEQQAFDLILGNAAAAFDLEQEDAATRERYDTSSFPIGHKKMRPSSLGHQMLLARRLVEAGCGFVTVHSAGWDMHADGNNPGIQKGMEMLGRPLDHAVGVFLDDLAQRGMAERVLLIITGDFGRTPKINKRGGRDHWPSLCTLALAGGGLRMGQVIGQSSARADVPATDPITPDHLLSTVLHVLFDVPSLRLRVDLPRGINQVLQQATPIPGLL